MNQAFGEDGEDGHSNSGVRKHIHLQPTICFKLSGAMAIIHGWTFISVDGKRIEAYEKGGFGSTPNRLNGYRRMRKTTR